MSNAHSTSNTSTAPTTFQINSDAHNLDLEFGVGDSIYGVPLFTDREENHGLELFAKWDSLTPREQTEYKALADEMNLLLRSFVAVSKSVMSRLGGDGKDV